MKIFLINDESYKSKSLALALKNNHVDYQFYKEDSVLKNDDLLYGSKPEVLKHLDKEIFIPNKELIHKNFHLKNIQRDLFIKNNIPTPKYLNQVEFPCIAKEVNSQGGHGVYLLKNQEDFLSVKDKDYLLQEFISFESGTDYRVFLVRDRIVAAMKRSNDKSFKSNIQQGGKASLWVMDEKVKETSLKLQKILGSDILGIDFIKDKEGYKVLEINLFPGWKALDELGYEVAEEIVKEIIL